MEKVNWGKCNYPIHRPAPPFSEQTTKSEVLETGNQSNRPDCSVHTGGQTGIFVCGVGKTVIITDWSDDSHCHKGRSVFAGVGERIAREPTIPRDGWIRGDERYCNGIIGQMNEPPGVRLRVALSALSCLNSSRWRRMYYYSLTTFFVFQCLALKCLHYSGDAFCSWIQPTLATEMGEFAGADYIYSYRIDYFDAGGLCSADDYSDPAPVATFTHLDATIALERVNCG